MQKLQFVTENGVARPNGSFRDLIRSQARRKGHTQSIGVQPHPNHPKGTSPKYFAELEIADCSTESTSVSPRFSTPEDCQVTLSCMIGNYADDPFDTLPIWPFGRTQFLIHHCKFSHCKRESRNFSIKKKPKSGQE